MIYDVLLLMLCTFSKGLFLEFVHVFQGTFCSILPLFQGTFGCKDTIFPSKKERNR